VSDQALPTLYSFRRCPYAMRARMALFASAMPYVLREVVLRDKPADMLALSPKGTVPVLQLPSGQVIDESLDVMRWALGHHDPLKWLKPQSGNAKTMTALVQTCDSEFKTHLDRYKYASRYEDCEPLVHRKAGEDFLRQLETHLGPHPYLFGDHATLADIAIAPFVRQFALADWDWFFATPFPNVHRWLNAFIANPPFTAVMDKVEPWKPGDEDVVVGPQPSS